MNSEEEQERDHAECARICGERGERGMHSIAPEMCPVQLKFWKNPRLEAKPNAQGSLFGNHG